MPEFGEELMSPTSSIGVGRVDDATAASKACAPWIRFSGYRQLAGGKRAGQFRVTLRAVAHNVAPTALRGVRMRVICAGKDGRERGTTIGPFSLRARGKKVVKARLTTPSLCARVRAETVSGTW